MILNNTDPLFQELKVAQNKLNVLFLCTGNSARSIMAEALLKRWGSDKFNAFSAGSKPKGEIHPKTIEILEKNDFSIEGLRSKSWEEFTGLDAPRIDFVITVCSNAANETCPIFPGEPVSSHWNIDDPARELDSAEKQDREFLKAFMTLEQRIQKFTNPAAKKLDKATLTEELKEMSD
jgi:protein-tyrosine-phosphatase